MALVKICRLGHVNSPDTILCKICGEDLSTNPLVEEPKSSSAADTGARPGIAESVDSREIFAPDDLVKICEKGHISSFEALLCTHPDCHIDITLNEVISYAEALQRQKTSQPGGAAKPTFNTSLKENQGEAFGMIQMEPQGKPRSHSDIQTGPEIIFGECQLLLKLDDGVTFEAKHADIVGRQEVGSEYLQHYPTVSRRHFQVFFRAGVWFLKNFSDNGTYINEKEVKVGEEKAIFPQDEIWLSSKCRVVVLS
ncbi:MAG: FHA domain-containing protein [Deltaproteobacteria bacterium]|jgi:hypothetical protein|nr:FHA domain-containing protein [Deltaproteobacteria bacterium]